MSNVIVMPNNAQVFFIKILLDGFEAPNYISGMNFPKLIAEIMGRGYTLNQIADATGMASRGHVHDLHSGRQKSVSFEVGTLLCNLHRSAMRRKVRK